MCWNQATKARPEIILHTVCVEYNDCISKPLLAMLLAWFRWAQRIQVMYIVCTLFIFCRTHDICMCQTKSLFGQSAPFYRAKQMQMMCKSKLGFSDFFCGSLLFVVWLPSHCSFRFFSLLPCPFYIFFNCPLGYWGLIFPDTSAILHTFTYTNFLLLPLASVVSLYSLWLSLLSAGPDH